MAALLHYKTIIVRLKYYYHMTVKSTEYTHRKVNMCTKIYEGDHFNEIKFKGDQLNVTFVCRKSSSPYPGDK